MPKENARYSYAEDIGNLEYLRASFVHQNFARHVHEGVCVGVVAHGAQSFFRSGANHIAPQNSIILVNADEVHTGKTATAEGWAYQAIYPLPEQLSEVSRELDGINNGCPLFLDPVIDDPELAIMLRRLYAVLEQSQNSLERQSWYVASMSTLIQRHGKCRLKSPDLKNAPRAIETVRQYLNDHYQRNVSLDELSVLVELNPQYLVRLFRKHIGVPPHAYQIQVRLNKAKTLIRKGLSLADVAVDVGFTDQSHMNRYFKRNYGTSPGRFLNS